VSAHTRDAGPGPTRAGIAAIPRCCSMKRARIRCAASAAQETGVGDGLGKSVGDGEGLGKVIEIGGGAWTEVPPPPHAAIAAANSIANDSEIATRRS
jgi:hypothetical protein